MSVIVGSYGRRIRFVVRRAVGSDDDFTTATSGALDVRWPRLTSSPAEEYVIKPWDVTLEVQSASLAYLRYTLQDGDIPRVGIYGVAAQLITPDGPIPCEPASLPVIDRF